MAVLDKWRDFWSSFQFGKIPKHESSMQRVSPHPQPKIIFNPIEPYDIQLLTIAHLNELWQLDNRCFVNGEAYSRETLEYLLSAPNGLSYRAVLPNNSMIGFIIAVYEADGTGHITTIGVAPEYRRRGIAQRLLEKVEDIFRKRNVQLMRLEVRTVNTGAQQLYLRAGYAVVQRLTKYYANGGDGLLMVKSLS
jgi:ribosomal-protein-alanine acetyltransferase